MWRGTGSLGSFDYWLTSSSVGRNRQWGKDGGRSAGAAAALAPPVQRRRRRAEARAQAVLVAVAVSIAVPVLVAVAVALGAGPRAVKDGGWEVPQRPPAARGERDRGIERGRVVVEVPGIDRQAVVAGAQRPRQAWREPSRDPVVPPGDADPPFGKAGKAGLVRPGRVDQAAQGERFQVRPSQSPLERRQRRAACAVEAVRER